MGLAMSILISLLLLQAVSAPPATAKPTASPPDDKIICKTITPTGSRLGGTRTCAPKREWDRLAAETQEGARDLNKSTQTCGGERC